MGSKMTGSGGIRCSEGCDVLKLLLVTLNQLSILSNKIVILMDNKISTDEFDSLEVKENKSFAKSFPNTLKEPLEDVKSQSVAKNDLVYASGMKRTNVQRSDFAVVLRNRKN